MTWTQYTSIVTKLANVFGKHRYKPEYVKECFKYWKDRDYIELYGLAEKAIGFNEWLDLNQPIKAVKYPVVTRQIEKPINTDFLDRHLAINGVKSAWELVLKSKKE